jgi:hypothetical protein
MTMAVAVVVVVIVVTWIFVMSVGMTVALIVVFMVPIARVVAIATRVLLVVRVRPVGSGKWGTLIVPRNPVILVSLGGPKALYPDELWCRGRRRWRLEVNWWWRNADRDRNL